MTAGLRRAIVQPRDGPRSTLSFAAVGLLGRKETTKRQQRLQGNSLREGNLYEQPVIST